MNGARSPILAILAVGAFGILTSCAQILGATDIDTRAFVATSFHEIRVGSGRRNFLLHLPPPPYTHPLPLLVMLHGSSANANVMMRESGMNAIADSVGAVVVYPNGTGEIPYFRLFWNEFGCCARPDGARGVDEKRMLAAVVDTIERLYPIDRTRVGLIGFSDPGSMAYLIACDQSEIWTAMAVVAGRLPRSQCVPARGVSTIVFHGTSDSNIQYANTSADVASWGSRLGCAFKDAKVLADVTVSSYGACHDGAEVMLYTITGGKHGWPGGKKSWVFAPTPPQSVDASRTVMGFVLGHPRR